MGATYVQVHSSLPRFSAKASFRPSAMPAATAHAKPPKSAARDYIPLRERDAPARAVVRRFAEVFGEDFFEVFFAATFEAFLATFVGRVFAFFAAAARLGAGARGLAARRLPALALRGRAPETCSTAGAGPLAGGASSGSAKFSSLAPK
jgi:hypothetical protein